MNAYLFILDSRICDLSDNYPWLISLFDILQVNTKSSTTVAELANDKNIETELLVNIISNAIIRGIPDYTMPSLDTGHTINDIVSYIITHHHLYLRSELPRLISSASKIISELHAMPEYLPELVLFLNGFKISLCNHFDKEESEVFPYISHHDNEIINDGLRQAILLMEFEHNHVSSSLNQLSLITENFHINISSDTRIKELINSLKTLTTTFDEHLCLEEKLIHDLLFLAENQDFL
jgi:iron-sulfur cluster repair protein YtfE (RIC family)